MSADTDYNLENPYDGDTGLNNDRKSPKETLLTRNENPIPLEEDQCKFIFLSFILLILWIQHSITLPMKPLLERLIKVRPPIHHEDLRCVCYNLDSILSGILNLASTHLGPGLLAMPYITRLCGVVGGTLFVWSGALISVLSKRMLCYSADVVQISDYRQLVAHVITPVNFFLLFRVPDFFEFRKY